MSETRKDETTEELVKRVRWVNSELNPDAPIASRGTGYSRLFLTHGDIEALCVAASRATPPAAETGEIVAWLIEYDWDPQAPLLTRHRPLMEARAKLDGVRVIPLYAAPAETGEEDDDGDNVALQVICRAFDNWEPIYERWLAYDKSQWLWWGRALGGFLRSEIAALAAPAPREVSEAMVERGVEGWIAAINESHSLARMEHEVSRHEIVAQILRAALSAETGTP